MKLKFSNLDCSIKDVNDDNQTIKAVFSTGTVDRHGEIVDQKSWILDNYLKNPVVLFGHDHTQPPIGKIVALGYNANGDLEGSLQFAAKQYPFANVIYQLYRDGFMKAFSVGFSAGAVDNIDGQIILRDNELYEISTVSVPANALALAKSKGLDTSALEEKYVEEAKTVCTHDKDCTNCGPGGTTLTSNDIEAAAAEEEIPAAEAVVEETPEETPEEEVAMEAEAATVEEKALVEKGPIADEIALNDMWEAKCEWMEDVYEVMYAFYDLAYSEETTVEQLPGLLAEAATILQTIADGTYVDADDAEDATKAVAKGLLKLKAGKVLSKDNHDMVKDTIKALTAVIAKNGEKTCPGCGALHDPETCTGKAAEADSEKGTTSADKTESFIKVETPAVRVAVKSTSRNKTKLINQAIRALLVEKRSITKSN